MFRRLVIGLVTLSCLQYSNSLIVPQELPTVLSLIYSLIPQIKKGTDSRLGFGFRLGEHADFQVVMELGPQKETQPIGDTDSSSSSKRHVNQNDYNAIVRQRDRITTSTEKTTQSWLQNWSNDIKNRLTKSKKEYVRKKAGIPPDEMKGPTKLPETALRQLQLLHYLATTTTGSPRPIVVAEMDDGDIPASAFANTDIRNKSSLEIQRHIPSFRPMPVRKTKGEISEELMDVSMD